MVDDPDQAGPDQNSPDQSAPGAAAPTPSLPDRRLPTWPRPGLLDLTAALLGEEGLPATEIEARDWAYVLTARAIPHVLRRQGWGWRLLVPRRRAEEALAEIGGYMAERRGVALPDPEAEPRRPSVAWPVLMVMGLVTGCWGLLLGDVTLLGRPVPWRSLGLGDTAAMLAGQWWRAGTALCLHADPAHLFGNAACATLFLSFLCRETGLGLGFALAVAAGMCGNLLKAAIQGPGLHFLGASTAVFGALGALGSVRLVSAFPPLSVRRFTAGGAVLMLLAMLGAGSEDTGTVDLAGHFFGFLSGVILGLAAGWLVGRRGRPGRLAQVVCGLAAAGELVAAWGLAVASWSG